MKHINKYKYLNKFKGKIRVSNRLLKFKRPKWNIAKKTLFKSKQNSKLLQVFKHNIQPGWEKTKKHYKNKINFARYLLIANSNNKRRRSALFKNKLVNRDQTLNTIFFKKFFKLDYFMYATYLTSSADQARQLLDSKKVSKNDNFSFYKTLSKGDIINLDINDYVFMKNKQKYNFSEGINSFYEYDYYTQSFIILKNFEDTNKKDIYLTTTNFI